MLQAFLILSCAILTINSQLTPNELKGLLAIYNSTGGVNWRIPWNLSTDPCIGLWNGVKCRAIGSTQYNIWSLVLQGLNLVGTIPSEIGLLTNLQFFYLSGNQIGGTIPNAFSLMGELVQVGFDKNALTGGFPDLSRLSKLQTVYLQNNKLTGPLDPWAKVPNIQYLWFSFNTLQGTIPNALGEIYSLQQIGLDSNMLTGTIPSGFGVRQNLFQAFYGQGNQFSGAFPTNLCRTDACDLSGPTNVFTCPLPNPPCCHVNTCK